MAYQRKTPGTKLNRSGHSRSVELLVAALNCFPEPTMEEVDAALRHMTEQPKGSVLRLTNGATLVWGNIERLVHSRGHVEIAEFSNAMRQYHIPRKSAPKYVVLMDSYKSSAPGQTTIDTAAAQVLLRVKGKADLTVIEASTIREVSIKRQESKEVKLSQQSRREEYEFKPKSAELSGGKGLSAIRNGLGRLSTLVSVGQRPPTLTDSQWLRMTEDDKRLSVLKTIYPSDWEEMVQLSMQEAGAQLDSFLGHAFSIDKSLHAHNLGVLLSHRLIGGMTEGHEEWMTSLTGPFRLDRAIEAVSQNGAIEVSWARRPSRSGKDSWVISAEFNGRSYVICKIEPSFDGARPEVSQTKGVIYYFQEGSQVRGPSDGSVWDLLAESSR